MSNTPTPSDVFLAQHAKLKPEASLQKMPATAGSPPAPAPSQASNFAQKDYDLIGRLQARISTTVQILTEGGALAIGFENSVIATPQPKPPALTLIAFDGLCSDPSDLNTPRKKRSLSSENDFPMMSISPFAMEHVLSSFSFLAARARLRLAGEEAFLDQAWKQLATFICKADIAYRANSNIIQSPLDLAAAALDPKHPLSSMDPAELAFFSAERSRLTTQRHQAKSTRAALNQTVANVFEANIAALDKSDLLSHSKIKVDITSAGQIQIFSNSFIDPSGSPANLPRFSNLGIHIIVDPLKTRSRNAFARLAESRKLDSLGQPAYVDRLWIGVAAQIAEAGASLRASLDLPLPQGLHAERERQELGASIAAAPAAPKRTRSAL